MECLNKLTERTNQVKIIHLRHLSPDCRRLLLNAEKVIEVNILEDPAYKVMVD